MVSSLSDAAWQRLADEAWAGLAEWRHQHPKATLREIEQAVDERLAGLRARMVRDAALASAAADPPDGEERPRCAACGAAMRLDGARTRRLRTTYDQEVTLTRRYARCPACGTGLFPPG
jgi:DNA-directed RNA polymerase subunit RPC12/RpoP